MNVPAAVGRIADLAGEGRCKTALLREYRNRGAAALAAGALACSAQIVADPVP